VKRGEAGGCDGDDLFVHEFQVIHPRPVLPAVMDRGVEGGAGEIEGFEAGGEVDRHLRVALGKAGKAGGEPVHPEGGKDGKVQAAAGGVGAQGDGGGGQEMQGLSHLGHVVLGGGGERKALAFAGQKRDAKLRLQPLQRAADGALGEAEFLGGGRGGAKAIHRLKCHQGGDRGQVAAGQHYEFPS
jgi:hypothetical protein